MTTPSYYNQANEWLFQSCELKCIAPSRYAGIDSRKTSEFVQPFLRYMLEHPFPSLVLDNLAHTYVWVGPPNGFAFRILARKGEVTWADILPDTLMAELKKHREVVLGFMLLRPLVKTPAGRFVRFVDCIETRLRGYNVARRMMNYVYENEEEDVIVWPGGIHNASYWRHFFRVEWNLTTRAELESFTAEAGITADDISNWPSFLSSYDPPEDKAAPPQDDENLDLGEDKDTGDDASAGAPSPAEDSPAENRTESDGAPAPPTPGARKRKRRLTMVKCGRADCACCRIAPPL